MAGPPSKETLLGDDLNVGMLHHFAPIRGPQRRTQRRRELLGIDAAAAYRRDTQREAQLERDLIGIFREDIERTGADVAESDDSKIHWLHKGFFLFDH